MSSLPLLALLLGCRKVPLEDVGASFLLADLTWFEEEQTLFAFWEIDAQQGIGENSVVEIRYRTDEGEQDWVDITSLPAVHTHEAVDCGRTSLCGSHSIALSAEPRMVGLRLRYHRDGSMVLEATPSFGRVRRGPPWQSRSLLVYGVFDESNDWIQWRARHVFPNLRNEEASALGLRRWFSVQDATHGPTNPAPPVSSYGYATACPADFAALDLPAVETEARAIFETEPLPEGARASAVICAQSTVRDATGTYTTGAIALKNPEVEPAFSTLRSPVAEAKRVTFFLAPCEREISAVHEAMQRQRLQAEEVPTTCTEGWSQRGYAERLARRFSEAVDAARTEGRDMVLVIGLHRDEDGPAEVLEEALARIVPAEKDKTSPRLAGAFVFDSEEHGTTDELVSTTLWCPTRLTSATLATVGCAVLPETGTLNLGPLTIGMLPVLPTREQYEEFLQTWPEAYAGRVERLSMLAPQFSATSEHTEIGEYGTVTFLDGERVSTTSSEAFSWCPPEETLPVAFRSTIIRSPEFAEGVAIACAYGKLPEEVCLLAEAGTLPLELLPVWHNETGEQSYELGLFWDYPYLLRMEYSTFAAGSLSAFGLSVPFGLSTDGETFLGTELWLAESFDLSDVLTRCTRFCDHPTFDSAGVYNVLAPFRDTWAQSCYRPSYPRPGDDGFPDDP